MKNKKPNRPNAASAARSRARDSSVAAGSTPPSPAAGPALLGLRPGAARAFRLRRHQAAVRACPPPPTRWRVWIGPVRPVLMFTLLDQRAALARRHVLLPRGEPADPLRHRAAGLPGHPAPAGVGRAPPNRDRTAVRRLSARCLFLLHPLQTESVAYIAGRSESLCGMFVLRLLRRRSSIAATKAISWSSVALVVGAVRRRRAHQGTGAWCCPRCSC